MPEQSILDPNQRVVYAVGAIVLCSQEIERLFKFVAPFMREHDGALGTILKEHQALAKKTLGVVAGQFVEAMSGETELFKQYIQELVTERNKIVHHFGENYGALLAAEKHAEVMAGLRKQHERSLSLLRLLQELALAIAVALRDTIYWNTAEEADFAAVCESFRDSLASPKGKRRPGTDVG
ncbi:hypothetical protein C8J98_10480 [Luteibacter sp. OK325]|jgi:hypothetical protein|uniref:hypothetical protein n=1 Tax=Luteibacter sp. OK325 TaxID=2135670 RepID=UPI000D332896|nr:hypothetical protein [Luteibacter sp. OK325]PTR32871.1 hypothetical protein C8J98_10480 [Luteibacter sp. OK325]